MEEFNPSTDSDECDEGQLYVPNKIEKLEVTGSTDVQIGHTINLHFNLEKVCYYTYIYILLQ